MERGARHSGLALQVKGLRLAARSLRSSDRLTPAAVDIAWRTFVLDFDLTGEQIELRATVR